MKVKSLKSNRKLIKGHTYETDYFSNDPNNVGNNRWYLGRIYLKDRGYYQCEDFTTTDGQPLPQIIYDVRSNIEPTKVSDIKKGDIIVCKLDGRFKYLIKGGKYRIEDVNVTSTTSYQTIGDIKLEGYKRWLSWNTWNFRKLSLQESRDLALSQIFDQEENFSVEFKRKFEQSKTKEKILIETLAKSILDKYRHELDIIDWGIEKNGLIYSMTREDFEPLMDKPLKEIIQIYENFSNE